MPYGRAWTSPYDQRSMASMSGIWDPNYYTGSEQADEAVAEWVEISSIVTLIAACRPIHFRG